MNFNFDIDSWTRTCRTVSSIKPLDCGIPRKLSSTQRLEAQIIFPKNPGEVQSEVTSFGNSEGLLGVVRFYATYPHVSQNLPPYIQIQLETFAPTRSLCVQSVRIKEPVEIPPMTCTNLDSSSQNGMLTQFGYNLRQVLPSKP